MHGRIEYYIYSGNGIENNGASLVEIICNTEELTKQECFKKFAKEIAMIAYIYQASSWEEIYELCPCIKIAKEKIEMKYNDKIEIKKIVVMNLSDNIMSLRS